MIHRTLALAVVLALAAPPVLAAQDLTRRQALDATGEIDIANVAGSVEVTGWDRGEVELVARLEGDADRLEFSGDAGHLVVKVLGPQPSRGPREARLTLRVPRGAAVDVQAVSAEVRVGAVTGRQRLETVSGEVSTEAFDQDVAVRSVSGEVRVAAKGGKGGATVSTVSGNVRLRGLAGTVEVQAVSGDFDLDLGAVSRGRFKTVSGNLQAHLALAPSGRVDVETMSGDVRLGIRPPVNAEFDLESFSGSLEACFGPEAQRSSKHGPGRELRFRQGDGSARLGVETLSGDVSLCDK